MYAIVRIAGQQYKLTPSLKLFVPLMEQKPGSKVVFEDVLLFDDGKSVKVGNPIVQGMKIEAEVLEHVKDDKVVVFKKKRRKQYQVKRGHRQQYTQIEVKKFS